MGILMRWRDTMVVLTPAQKGRMRRYNRRDTSLGCTGFSYEAISAGELLYEAAVTSVLADVVLAHQPRRSSSSRPRYRLLVLALASSSTILYLIPSTWEATIRTGASRDDNMATTTALRDVPSTCNETYGCKTCVYSTTRAVPRET